MDASKIQKFSRLSAKLALVVVLIYSCARDLKKESDIVGGPQDLTQKIEDVSQDKLQKLIDKERSEKETKVDAKSKEVSQKDAAQKKLKKSKIPFWTPSHWPFGVGERMVLAMRYGPIEGGLATIEVKEPKIVDGEPVLHYHAQVRSSKVLEFFYKVDDSMDTWVGANDHLPRRQEIQQNESARWGRRVVVFDQKAKAARYYSHLTKKNGEVQEIRRDDPLENYPQDVFGALFFYRFADDLKKLNFPVHDRFRHWNNELIFEEQEKIRVPAGEFDTLRFKINPRISGDLKPQGDVLVWFKNDPSKILIKFKAKIKVGAVTGELREYQAGQNPQLSLPNLITPMRLNQMGVVSQ